jgi:hypothetical protein
MERLTDIINGWTFEETIKTAESFMKAEKNIFKWDVLRHLRDFAENYRERIKGYQQLEEQGRLIKLPCKEAYTQSGDIVYLIYDDEVVECTHCGLGINPVDGKAYIALVTDEDIFPYRRPVPEYDLDPTDWCTNAIDAEVGEIGKTVFFTKSEAEAKLEELRGKENE